MILGFIRILKILTFVRFIQEKYNAQKSIYILYKLVNSICNIYDKGLNLAYLKYMYKDIQISNENAKS